MAHSPQNIDDFVRLMAKADMRAKAQLAEELVVYLSDMENSIVSNDLGLLVDNLMPWLIGSHFKVSLCINIHNSNFTQNMQFFISLIAITKRNRYTIAFL